MIEATLFAASSLPTDIPESTIFPEEYPRRPLTSGSDRNGFDGAGKISMSLGQIGICSRPGVGMFFFPLKTGSVGPVATSQPRRPVPRYLKTRCASSVIPDERNGLTSAQRGSFEESFSQGVDANNVEHRSLAHRRSGHLSPPLTLAGPGIGSRGALLTSPIHHKKVCLPVACLGVLPKSVQTLPQTFGMSRKRCQCILVPQVLRPSSRATTLLARQGRTIVPRHLKSLKAAMP